MRWERFLRLLPWLIPQFHKSPSSKPKSLAINKSRIKSVSTIKTAKNLIQLSSKAKTTPTLINTSKKTSLISTKSVTKADSHNNPNKAKTESKKTKPQLED